MKDGRTPLIAASGEGHLRVVQALLANGAAVNAKTSDGATALILASYNGHREVVQMLLAEGAGVNAKMNDGRTALSVAKASVRALLVQAGAKQ
jgi:serine/threonine-protein phosphatase 6 regulatory ankyrin repeat subunit B